MKFLTFVLAVFLIATIVHASPPTLAPIPKCDSWAPVCAKNITTEELRMFTNFCEFSIAAVFDLKQVLKEVDLELCYANLDKHLDELTSGVVTG